MTGTPSGIAGGRSPPNWLRPGDVVEGDAPGQVMEDLLRWNQWTRQIEAAWSASAA
eukprot:gene2278-61805_t